MGKTRCDPIDTKATLSALAESGCGLIGPSRDAALLRRLYADYASVAARPYARASWEKVLRAAEMRKASQCVGRFHQGTWQSQTEREFYDATRHLYLVGRNEKNSQLTKNEGTPPSRRGLFFN